jgi:type I restriction enzyme S subunit
MIEDLKPYPEYKDSGLPWLGQVPAHWEIRPASGAFSPIRERNTGMKEKIILSLSYGRIVVKPAGKLHGLVPESFDTYQIVNPGVTVIRTTDLQNDKTSLRTGIVRDRGIITSAYLALSTSDGLLPEFGYQILNAWDITKAIYGYGSGLRQNLDFSDFRRMPVAVPPIAEQAFIARFLAWATNCLDRAIGAKRRIIALLQEQKQAIIHRAVTRGLDPSVALKDSGIPWLGEIPVDWEVRKLKFLSPQVTVGIVIQPARLYASNGVPALRSLNISSGTISTNQLVHISEEGHLANSKSQLREGDVVVVRTGRTGIAVIIPPELDGSNCIDLLVVRKSKELLSEYLLMYLSSCAAKEDIATHSVGAIQSHYNTSTLANLRIPLPPTNEQRLLLLECDSKIAPIHTAISRLEREITLLREYRTRLIADVVTGKLDVREVAKGLPEVELQDQPDVAAGYDADEAEDDAESDLIDTAED